MSLSISSDRGCVPCDRRFSQRLFWVGTDVFGGDLSRDCPTTLINLWPALYDKPAIEILSETFTNGLRQMQPSGPYFLGGHCFGGLVAYEMARRLVESGQDVRLLVLVQPWTGPVDNPFRLRLIRHLLRTLIDPTSVLEWVYGQRNRPIGQKMWQKILFDLASKSLNHYKMKPYAGKLSLILGDRTLEHYFPRAVWRRFAKGGVEVHLVHGQNPEELVNAGATAAIIGRCLEAADTSIDRARRLSTE